MRPGAEIHLSGEWYSGVSRYRIMGADSVQSQSSGDLLKYEVVDELKPVFNFGAGIEWMVGDAFSVYSSLVRNASAAPENPFYPFAFGDQVSNSTSQADGFFVGAGVSFDATWIDLTAGATYGVTTEKWENPLTSGGPGFGQSVLLPGDIQDTRRRWRFLLGFTIPLVEAIADEPLSR